MPGPIVPASIKPLIGIDVAERVVTRQISSAELLTSFTTPITLVGAKVGVAYVPRYGFFFKPAGLAYTIAGVTQVAIRVGTTSECGPGAAGLLDQTVDTGLVMFGPGSAAALFSGFNITTLANQSLNFTCLGANPAAGNTPLNLCVFYNEFTPSFGLM